jgi:hypothetical protein
MSTTYEEFRERVADLSEVISETIDKAGEE